MSSIFTASLFFYASIYIFFCCGEQHKYDLQFSRFEVKYLNSEYAFVDGCVFHYNRTSKAFNLTLMTRYGFTDESTLSLIGYVFMSNTYRMTAIQYTEKIHRLLSIDVFDLPRMLNEITSPPFQWPIKPNVKYKVGNFVPNVRKYPPLIPDGKYRVEHNLFYNKTLKLATTHLYLEVFPLMKWHS